MLSPVTDDNTDGESRGMLSIQKTEVQEELERRETSPEQVEVLQEELELEKEKKEIISSLYDDWIFEYNIRERSIVTISGNSNQYRMTEGRKGEKTFLMLEGLHPEDLELVVESSREMHNLEPVHLDVRVLKNGEYRWISMTTKILYGKGGRPVSLLGKISDIDEKKREELRLQAQAMRDSLTGLLNRAAFQEQAEWMIEQAGKQEEKTPAMLIVDIDQFKQINDNYGHLYGDTVLVAMADALRNVFGETAAIGRFGGDEFTVFLPHAEKAALEEDIVKLRKIYAKDIAQTAEGHRVTCSIGASRYGVDGTSVSEMLKNADSALYYIKENGRDSYAICTEPIKKKFAEGSEQVLSAEPKDEERRITEEITEFALELLEGSKDLKSAMNMLLMKVGKRFRLAAVSVREYNSQGMPEISYLWSDATNETLGDAKVFMDMSERKRICVEYRKNQMVEIPDVNMLPPQGPLYRLYKAKGIQALYQCPFASEGEVFGYIAYVDSRVREWTDIEKQSLSMIARIIGNYLAREYAYEKIARKIELMKSMDEVTGLLKYDKFKEVAQTLLNQSNEKVRYAIVSTDFANFKYFNEVYGFRSGDEVLKDFASLAAKHNPRAVAACRDYADNFLIMVTVKDADSLYNNIASYNKIFMENQNEKFLDSKLELCSGAYVITNPEAGIVQALDNANTARKLLKEKGNTGILMFEPSMRVNRMRDIAMLHMLEEAIENHEFCLYLQPKFSLESGKLVGAEALSRWVKPGGRVVAPAEFIPPLEKSGKIVQLDFCMYEMVLRQQRLWLNAGYSVVPVSVNLSRHHIKDEKLVEKLVNLLEVYDIDSSLIEIEITESAFIEDQAALIAVMKEFKQRGFGVSIDDFGTGYSSLSMLTELPADIVKLDKEFLKHSDSDITKGMLNNVIRLIKDNRMEVICEGVEMEEQAEFLAKAGCDMGQGYYFSKPMPAAEFEKMYFK